MVRKHEAWGDSERGYERGTTSIVVQPAIVEVSGDLVSYQASVESEEDANAYSVDVYRNMDNSAHTHNTLVRFNDPLAAWEYANLATHYFEAVSDDMVAEGELRGANDSFEDHWQPEGIVEDTEAETVMRRMLGHYEYRLDEALEQSEVSQRD